MDIQNGPGLSPWQPPPEPEADAHPDRRRELALAGLRHGLPAALVLAGLLVAAIGGNAEALEGGFMIAGAGIAVWLLNLFFRMGASGEQDRDREDEARAYFDRHGRWPDEV